ncbi:hypothetical protein [Leifsonia xyli]|nr:hypothetical protein [Leifsonia xyli]
MGSAGGSARQVADYVLALVREHGGAADGRWLAFNTSMSKTYAYERLNGIKPFNMNDLDQVASALGTETLSLMRQALVSVPSKVKPIRKRNDELTLDDIEGEERQAALSDPEMNHDEDY